MVIQGQEKEALIPKTLSRPLTWKLNERKRAGYNSLPRITSAMLLPSALRSPAVQTGGG